MKYLPSSIPDLVQDFQSIGIEKSMNIMVHSSLSKIGWVIGGANAVVNALLQVVGKEGTIVMPAATPMCMHPEDWELNVNEDWFTKIVAHLPVFDKAITPTSMGIIPETFRNWPDTYRSDHPISSVCANGPLAEDIVSNHSLAISEGKNTPYEEVYKKDFKILLLGVGFNRCTMLHFAESRSKHRRLTKSRYPIMQEGRRVWVEVEDMGNDNSTHFPVIGKQYMEQEGISVKKIAQADTIFIDNKSLVDFATAYFDKQVL